MFSLNRRIFPTALAAVMVIAQSVSTAGESNRLVFPNPFYEGERGTTFTLSIPAGGAEVIIDVYDIRGTLIRTLMPKEGPREPVFRQEGTEEVDWDGRDMYGNEVPPGMYVGVLTANGSIVKAVKVVKLRKG